MSSCPDTDIDPIFLLSYGKFVQFTSFYCLMFICFFAFLTTLTIVANKCKKYIKCVWLLTL